MKRDSKTIALKRRSPVKKFMDKLHKPRTHADKTKYKRRSKYPKDIDEDTT